MLGDLLLALVPLLVPALHAEQPPLHAHPQLIRSVLRHIESDLQHLVVVLVADNVAVFLPE